MRAIFPILMFLLAAGSFAFGIWQFMTAQQQIASANSRMAYIVGSIEESSLARAQKQSLYASIMEGLPAAPRAFGFDFSGSFASQDTGDSCTSDGQRAICRALRKSDAKASTITSVCGACTAK